MIHQTQPTTLQAIPFCDACYVSVVASQTRLSGLKSNIKRKYHYINNEFWTAELLDWLLDCEPVNFVRIRSYN